VIGSPWDYLCKMNYLKIVVIASFLAVSISSKSQPVPTVKVREVNCDSLYIRPDGGTSFYDNNPTYIDNDYDSYPWQIATPSEQGIDPTILNAGIATLKSSPSIFSFLLLRNDQLLAEKYFNGSEPSHSNNVHSASKGIVSAMIGVAIQQGFITSLDQGIFDFFPDYPLENDDPEKGKITIRHLLTMTAGLEWEEDYTEYMIEDEDNWVDAILAQPLLHTPGEVFNYSTGNTHLLSAILNRATGMSNCEFTHDYLLTPLGVAAEHWGRDPQAVYSGGYNFYITARELAKFGLLYLHKGQWMGQSLIPQQWVEASLQNQFFVDSDYQYGYCWWLTHISGYDVLKAWGYGGQYICLIPDLDIVVVSTSNTVEYFGEWDIDVFIENYIIPALNPNWTNVVSQSELSKPEVSILPNPLGNEAFFKITTSNCPNCKLLIFNALGKAVKSLDFSGSKEVLLRRDALPPGIYFYQLLKNDLFAAGGKFIID